MRTCEHCEGRGYNFARCYYDYIHHNNGNCCDDGEGREDCQYCGGLGNALDDWSIFGEYYDTDDEDVEP